VPATRTEGNIGTIAEAYAEARASGYTHTDAKAMSYAEAEVMAHARAKNHSDFRPEAKVMATDYLRLSMHFFHPIQQCAQQIYHTAIPLSPTSSWLHRFCLQSIIDDQLSCVTAFSGAPDTWGSLLRTIDVRPSQVTCIATSGQRIISACKDIVKIYDAVTFVLQQSLSTPETVTKIQASPDGSILFFAHMLSVTMRDVQTGGLIHTFATQSKINDIAISATHIACGTSDGSVEFWNIDVGGLGRGFRAGESVVTIHWLSPKEFAVATQNTFYVCNIAIGETICKTPIPGHLWGMVYLEGSNAFLVGGSWPSSGVGQRESIFIRFQQFYHQNLSHITYVAQRQSPMYSGQLSNPILVEAKTVVCITPTNGVQSFNAESNLWTSSPPLLSAATSVAMSLNRNLVAQAKDFIQIFSVDVLKSDETHKNIWPSHIYPLGGNHIICPLQPTRHLTLLDLRTMQELHHDDNTLLLRSLLTSQLTSAHASFGHGLVAEFGITALIQAWWSGTPLPWTGVADEDMPLRGWSPECTKVVTLYMSPQPELCVTDTKSGITLANLPLEDANFELGETYDITFDSETKFYLKVDGPGWHTQIPYDITLYKKPHLKFS